MKLALVPFFCLGVLSSLAAADYPRPDLLVEPNGLTKDAAQFIVLDARDRAKYEQGHVPNAQWVDHAIWAKAFEDGKDSAGWTKRIATLGIGEGSKIVIYDDVLNKDAARIWWILKYWGVSDVRLLNGRWKGWAAASLPVQKETPPAAAESKFVAKSQVNRLATKQKLLDSLKTHTLQIVDARSEGEFCGTDKGTNKRGGAIPGAKHLEWTDLLDKESQRFKSAGEISKLFSDAGIDPKVPTATHCQSGGRASVMAFGLELMGAKDVGNYYRSWAEWGNAEDAPIEPGKPKK